MKLPAVTLPFDEPGGGEYHPVLWKTRNLQQRTRNHPPPGA